MLWRQSELTTGAEHGTRNRGKGQAAARKADFLLRLSVLNAGAGAGNTTLETVSSVSC